VGDEQRASARALAYHVFDLLKLADKDLREEPQLGHKKTISRLLNGVNPRPIYVDHIEREGLAMYAGALALRLEGIVAKDSSRLLSRPATPSLARGQEIDKVGRWS